MTKVSKQKTVHERKFLMDRFYFGVLTAIEPKRVPKASLFRSLNFFDFFAAGSKRTPATNLLRLAKS
ncbi:hypothetical protein R0H03_00815 [Pediococcus acidilactici]|uniref:Uncharacterized protein n=1 Tax=Pediococcus acidilactici TaxID=1254 RepID=A0AAW8YLH2_PEDAC|nr:hypothetical protein [Pediococcus acidilactici]MDV2910412.1 hypothetical protein [Pediococcus acidilactici]